MPVDTPGEGVFLLLLDYNQAGLLIALYALNLKAPITGSHIHNGGPDEVDPVVFPLICFR